MELETFMPDVLFLSNWLRMVNKFPMQPQALKLFKIWIFHIINVCILNQATEHNE